MVGQQCLARACGSGSVERPTRVTVGYYATDSTAKAKKWLQGITLLYLALTRYGISSSRQTLMNGSKFSGDH